MMGGNQNTNQNIFAPQGTPGNTGANQGSDQSTSGSGVKTSTEGDVNDSAPATSSGSGPKVVGNTDTQAADNRSTQAAFKANQGKVQTPAAFQAVQGSLDSGKAALAQKASDYAASQAASHNYGVGTDVADQAVKKQDQNAYGKISSLLGKSTADQVDTFDPGDLHVSDADLLNTNAGIKNLVARGQGPKYSPNMAAFDSMLLQADPNFQKQVSGLKTQAADLKKNVTDTSAKAQADAATAAQSNLTSSQQAIKDYLAQSQSGITAAEAAAAAKANADLPSIIAAQKDKVAADLLKAQKLRAQQALGGTFGAGRADAQLNAIQEDPSKYINWISGYDPSQFVTQDQASQYNTINSLLGQGGKSQVASGALPELYSAKGNDLYDSLISQATTARQATDKTDRSSIQSILDQANQQAQADNARRLSLTGNEGYTKSLSDLANQFSQTAEFSPYKSSYNPTLANQVISDYSRANPLAQLGSGNNPNLSATDVINSQQAEQLNQLSRDLGLSTTYGAGSYSGGGGNLINSDSFKQALLKALSNYQSSTQGFGQVAAPAPAAAIPMAKQLAIPSGSNPYEKNVDLNNRPAPLQVQTPQRENLNRSSIFY